VQDRILPCQLVEDRILPCKVVEDRILPYKVVEDKIALKKKKCRVREGGRSGFGKTCSGTS